MYREVGLGKGADGYKAMSQGKPRGEKATGHKRVCIGQGEQREGGCGRGRWLGLDDGGSLVSRRRRRLIECCSD